MFLRVSRVNVKKYFKYFKLFLNKRNIFIINLKTFQFSQFQTETSTADKETNLRTFDWKMRFLTFLSAIFACENTYSILNRRQERFHSCDSTTN